MARVLVPGRSFYICGGYANCANDPPVLKACELDFYQAIIWVKEHPVLTRKDSRGSRVEGVGLASWEREKVHRAPTMPMLFAPKGIADSAHIDSRTFSEHTWVHFVH
jgi:hypothetical protein